MLRSRNNSVESKHGLIALSSSSPLLTRPLIQRTRQSLIYALLPTRICFCWILGTPEKGDFQRNQFMLSTSPSLPIIWHLRISMNFYFPKIWTDLMSVANTNTTLKNMSLWTETQTTPSRFFLRRRSSLEERNHSDQGAQRDEQDAEGRGGAGVAQIRVAAVHLALLHGITHLLGSIAHVLVRTGSRDRSLVRQRGITFHAPIEPGVTIGFLSVAIAAVLTNVAFDRQDWKSKCNIKYIMSLFRKKRAPFQHRRTGITTGILCSPGNNRAKAEIAHSGSRATTGLLASSTGDWSGSSGAPRCDTELRETAKNWLLQNSIASIIADYWLRRESWTIGPLWNLRLPRKGITNRSVGRWPRGSSSPAAWLHVCFKVK